MAAYLVWKASGIHPLHWPYLLVALVSFGAAAVGYGMVVANGWGASLIAPVFVAGVVAVVGTIGALVTLTPAEKTILQRFLRAARGRAGARARD